MGATSKNLRRVMTHVLLTLAVLGAMVIPAGHASAQNEDVPFETDPIQSAGTDGPIWDSAVVGDEVWLGGSFSNVRQPAVFGQADVPSQNLAVIDLNTGLMVDRTFAINGTVWSVESRDRTVWVGGEFTTVNGQQRRNLVAFDALTGEIRPEFTGSSQEFVWDLVEADGWLYAGTDGGVERFDPRTGQRDAGFTVGPNSSVRAIDVSGDLIAVGAWNGQSSGVWRISTEQREFAMDNEAYDVEFTRDGSTVYVADSDNDFDKYRVSDGTQLWTIGQSAGDSQAVAVTDDGAVVFGGFHQDWNDNESRKAVALDPSDGRELDWYVEMDSYWGVFSIDITPQGLIITGQFENTNGLETRRVAIFRPDGPWEEAKAVVALGDADGSGLVDAADTQTILDHLAGAGPDGFNELGADVNEDGRVDLVDALLVARQAR